MRRPTGLSPLFVLLHVLLVALVLVSLASGARIALDHLDGWRASPSGQWLQVWLPQGQVFLWHVTSALLLLGLAAAYAVRVAGFRDRNWRSPGASLRGINVSLHWTGVGLLGALAVTGGLGVLELDAVSGGAQRTAHGLLALLVVLYLVAHVSAHALSGGLRELLGAFWPRSWDGGGLRAALPLLVGAACVGVLWGFPWSRPLAVPRVSVAPVVDGDARDAAWDAAPERLVQLHLGNDPARPLTQVRVRAVRIDDRFYLLARWPDPERSLTHLPLLRADTGWTVFSDGFARDDERTWYEDKLAVMVAADPLAALASIHFGPRPLAVAPSSRSGRGYHYTTDGQVLDIWHWKAVRTNHLSQADDQYFGPPLPCFVCAPRYFGGYASDPKLTGGYRDNWQFFRPSGVEPKRLPLTDHYVFDRAEVVAQGGRARLSMRFVDGYPWSAELDRFPVDTLIPSILTSEPLQGDRGHVGARGRWADGEWTLELSRSLDTESPYDVPLGDDTYLWFAVFDHAQSRHAYHLRPLRLEFME